MTAIGGTAREQIPQILARMAALRPDLRVAQMLDMALPAEVDIYEVADAQMLDMALPAFEEFLRGELRRPRFHAVHLASGIAPAGPAPRSPVICAGTSGPCIA